MLRRLGEMAAAVEHLSESVTLTPDGAMTRLNLAAALTSRGDDAEVVDQYRRVIQLLSDSLAPVSGLAWVLATFADDAVRNPAESVRAADGETYRTLEILAAAHAAVEDYDKAVNVCERVTKLSQE